MKAFSFLLLALMVASLLFVHTASYEPAVSYILLYLVSSVGIITAAVAGAAFVVWERHRRDP